MICFCNDEMSLRKKEEEKRENDIGQITRTNIRAEDHTWKCCDRMR